VAALLLCEDVAAPAPAIAIVAGKRASSAWDRALGLRGRRFGRKSKAANEKGVDEARLKG